MFIGHFAAGLAVKKVDSSPSLGTLFMASQFIDLLWPFFLLMGLETVKIDPGNTAFTPLDFISYPFTHSLAGVLVWAILFGGIYYWKKKQIKTSMILGGLVLSHWFLDLFTHRPDLLIIPGVELKVGLGLWNSIPATIIIESLIFITGAYLYFKVTKARNKTGSLSLWSVLIFLGTVYVANIFGPPPPSADAIAWTSLTLWLIVIWGYWIERNRSVI